MQLTIPLITTRTMVGVSEYPMFFDTISRVAAIACEVLARRIVHKMAPDRLNAVMSTRYKHKQIDGDDSDPASALEMAIDTHW